MGVLTRKLNLNKPEIDDDIQDTILISLANDMQTIDDNFDETVPNIVSHLDIGQIYETGKKFWNRNASIGGFAGWINTRSGVHAPEWLAYSTYQLGEIVKSKNDNGHYYECIVSGTSVNKEPLFDTVSNSVAFDISGAITWMPNYHYQIGDIVVQTNGDISFYFRCTKDGFSDSVEPTWNKTVGATIADGTTEYRVFRTIQWREMGVTCDFVQFGAIGYSSKKYSENIGDGVGFTFNVNHNLNTQDVFVSVRETSAPYLVIDAVIEVSDANNISVTFQSPPSLDEYRVTIIG